MSLVCIDFETNGLNIASKTFKILSTAFYYENGNTYFTESFEDACTVIKTILSDPKNKILVYNISFEGPILLKFGLVKDFNQLVDVWRLSNYVNNTTKDRKTSLNASVSLFFKVADYKKPFFDKMIELGLAKTDKEAHTKIAMLPKEDLEAYNIADVKWTYELYKYAVDKLKEWDYLTYCREDYKNYSAESLMYAKAYLRGVKIDRELALKNVEELDSVNKKLTDEVLTDEKVLEFEKRMNADIEITPNDIRKFYKEVKGEKVSVKKDEISKMITEELTSWVLEKKWKRFNFNSSKQKIEFFIEFLGNDVASTTPKGAPKVSKNVIKEYGGIGITIAKINDTEKQVKELQKLIDLSIEDGLLHPTLRSGSTISGRSSSKIS